MSSTTLCDPGAAHSQTTTPYELPTHFQVHIHVRLIHAIQNSCSKHTDRTKKSLIDSSPSPTAKLCRGYVYVCRPTHGFAHTRLALALSISQGGPVLLQNCGKALMYPVLISSCLKLPWYFAGQNVPVLQRSDTFYRMRNDMRLRSSQRFHQGVPAVALAHPTRAHT